MNLLTKTFIKPIALFISLFFLFCLCQPLVAQDSTNFVEGSDYRKVRIKLADTLNELDKLQQVADIEVFYWYGCEPCREVEEKLAPFLASHPQLTVRRTPVVAQIDWRQQAYLQPIGEQLAQKLNFPDPQSLYQSCIEDCSVFSSFELIKSWLKSKTQVTDLPRLNESAIWQAEKDYRKRADSFSIAQVPTIIIKESFAVDANSAGSLQRLQQLIEHLLTLDTH